MNKKINILHGSALLLYEMYAGLAYSFGSYILIEKGFSSTVAGIIMSLGNIVGFILQPIISNITDNSKKITIIHVLIIETAFSFVACVLNVFTQSPTISAAISFVVILAAASLLEALYNSVHFILNDNGYNVDFPKARALGSISFGLFSYLLGVLFEKLPFNVTLSLGPIVCALTIVVLLILNKDTKIDKNNDEEDKITYSQFLKAHPNFIKIIISFVFIFLGYTMVDNFYILKLNAIGAGSASLGLIILIKTLMEFPSFFMFKRIEKLFTTKRCLILSAFMFGVKNIVIFIAPNTQMICVAQIFQALALGLMSPSMISYINQITTKKETVRGQALFSMAVACGAILSSLLAGLVYDNLGLNVLYISSIIVIIIAAMFFTHFVLKDEH
ncbi:MAG: MFS transporter [Firmicutes bacterium]|nr:MFS transporter [Candidatus Colivicinus equi]